MAGCAQAPQKCLVCQNVLYGQMPYLIITRRNAQWISGFHLITSKGTTAAPFRSMPSTYVIESNKHIRLALELNPRRYKSAAEAVENGGGDGLRLISYVGGIAMCSKSAMAAITPPMLSAALADNVSTTDTYNIHTNNSHYCILSKIDEQTLIFT